MARLVRAAVTESDMVSACWSSNWDLEKIYSKQRGKWVRKLDDKRNLDFSTVSHSKVKN